MEEKLSRMERLHFKKTLDKEAKRLFTLYTGYCLLGYFILGIIVTFTTYSLSSVVATVIFGSAYKDVLHGNISKINNYPEKLNRQYRRLEIILTKLAASLQTVIILIFFYGNSTQRTKQLLYWSHFLYTNNGFLIINKISKAKQILFMV